MGARVQERRNGWRLHKQKWDAGGRRAILLATHCRASDFCQALPKWNHTTLQGCVIPYNRSDDTNPFLILSCDDEMRTGRASKDHIVICVSAPQLGSSFPVQTVGPLPEVCPRTALPQPLSSPAPGDMEYTSPTPHTLRRCRSSHAIPPRAWS